MLKDVSSEPMLIPVMTRKLPESPPPRTGTMPVLSERLLHALLTIHATPPRLIATPTTLHTLNASAGHGGHPGTPGRSAGMGSSAKQRASVAIIIRIRPDETPSSTSSNLSGPSSLPTHPSDGASAPSSRSVSPDPDSDPDRTVTEPTEYVSATTSTVPPALPTTPSTSPPPLVREDVPTSLRKFFAQPWVRRGTPEILFIKRAKRQSDRWSSHVAFPGGRSEPEDDDGHFTALRETWEETGLDLADKSFLGIGGLDDREITTSLGRRLLMILSPYVFLSTSPHTPAMDLQPSEVASAHWVPLDLLTGGHKTRWGDVKVDIASRLAPRSRTIRWGLRILIGSMHFQCILLPDRPDVRGAMEKDMEDDARKGKARDDGSGDLRLWGLTLGMTLDLVAFMSAYPTVQHPSPATYPFFAADPSATNITSPDSSPTGAAKMRKRKGSTTSSSSASAAAHAVKKSMGLEELNALSPGTKSLAPSMTSIFPRFTYPDINFLIWVFGGRYRRLVKRWNDRRPPQTPGSAPLTPNPWSDRRVSWAGVALGQFYTAVRKALVVVILIRAVALGGGLAGLFVWASRTRDRRRLLAGAR